MIEVEETLFTYLSTKIKEKFGEKYPEMRIYNEVIKVTPSFPTIFINEISNVVCEETKDNVSIENSVLVGYQVEVFTIGDFKKKVAKEIFNYIDELLIEQNFMRIFNEQVSNLEDTNIYRIIGRYNAIIGKDNIIYVE